MVLHTNLKNSTLQQQQQQRQEKKSNKNFSLQNKKKGKYFFATPDQKRNVSLSQKEEGRTKKRRTKL